MMNEEVALDVVKKKRTRPDLAEKNAVHVDGKELGSQIGFSMILNNLPEIDTNNAEQVKERLNEYFRLCVQYEMKPCLAGMAESLGVERTIVWKWCTDQVPSKPKEVVNAVKKARLILANLHENWMLNGQINPVVGIFLGKNNYGYADKTEVVVTPNNPLGETTDEDRRRIEAKYGASIAPPDEDGEVI